MYTGITIIRLVIASLLPVLVAVGFYLADKKSIFGKLPYIWKQLIFGVGFGAVAILATEIGIPTEGAILNVRNAAPLTAGLIFGWPAGLLRCGPVPAGDQRTGSLCGHQPSHRPGWLHHHL